jgi:hypothetical protein
MMGLVRDPTGSNLPDDCWRQMTAKADAVLFITSEHDRENAGKALERNLEWLKP